MNKRHLLFYSVLFSCLCVGVSGAQEEAESGPSFAPIEIFACNYNKGQSRSNLDKVIAEWNAWGDRTGLMYESWLYTADYNSPEYAFDIAWLGAWPNGKAMGEGTDNWFADGGEISKKFDKVLKCQSHSNFASMQVRAGDSENAKNAVLQFSDCTIGTEANMEDAMTAVRKWNDYMSAQGSKGSEWVFFPVYGADVDYDFKLVGAYPNYSALGVDYDRYGNGGGYIKAGEIIGGAFDCNVARVYRSEKVRDRTPEE